MLLPLLIEQKQVLRVFTSGGVLKLHHAAELALEVVYFLFLELFLDELLLFGHLPLHAFDFLL